MKEKPIVAAMLAAVTGAGIPAFAETATYTSGDTSLANGKKIVQAGDGSFCLRGLISSFH